MPHTLLRHCAACLALVALLAGGSGAAHAARTVQRDDATAHALDDGRVLYSESHWRYVDDAGTPTRLVVYRCPGGAAFARKQLQTRERAVAPDFDFIDARSGRREGVRVHAGGREVYVQADADAPMRRAPLDVRGTLVIDAGFDAFVREHWTRLTPGRAVAAPFLVPSRLRTLPLRLEALRDGVERGRAVRVLRLGLDSWFGAALPDVELTYDVADRRLRRFRGLGTIRSERGALLPVRIEFEPATQVQTLSDAQLRALQQAPLVASCDA